MLHNVQTAFPADIHVIVCIFDFQHRKHPLDRVAALFSADTADCGDSGVHLARFFDQHFNGHGMVSGAVDRRRPFSRFRHHFWSHANEAGTHRPLERGSGATACRNVPAGA
ncbi:MAG: hypothetical protein LBI92_01700 [Azoarcus sp.]|nr:hypothetical protein [Azoarcus sp.]